ncbi:MAG: DNA-binding protein [Gammaproteobacteria bacterium]
MARIGVTYRDIAKAAEAIKIQNLEPTVDRVREHLGTGSKSTIAPLLKRWRSDNGKLTDVSELPNDLVDVVKSLHERVQQMADHRIEQAQQAFNASSAELQTELSTANGTITQLTACQQDLESQIEQLNKEKREQSQSLEDVRVKLAKAELKRDESIARITELKESVSELRQENKDIRSHFEHYQQRTVEDRQQEREQFRSVNQGLKDQFQDSQHRLGQAEARISELLNDNTQLQRSSNELEQANAALNSSLNQKSVDIQNLQGQLEEALSKHQEYKIKQEHLKEKIAALTLQNTDLDKTVAALSQAFEDANTRLKASQDNVALLSNENKIILQEKAVIQGQFKQLQSSLK